MRVEDRDRAELLIQRIGYYRLSAYWYHWRQSDETGVLTDGYHPSASFDDSVSLYTFDRQLRLTLLDAIERIEVALRVAVSNVAGRRDPFIHTSTLHLGAYAVRVDPDNGLTPFSKFVSICTTAYQRSSEDFVKHCRERYEDGPALWVHIETWDFGLLSNFYKLLQEQDKLEVSEFFGTDRYTMFESWLASLNYVRNLCAHHSRLFRRSLVVQPGTKDMRYLVELAHVRKLEEPRSRKMYPVIAILVFLMRQVAPDSEWQDRMMVLLKNFPDLPTASLSDYGFPAGWDSQPIWQRPVS